MSRRVFRGWRARLLVAVVVALALAGTGLAYWTSSGSGSGSSTVGNPEPLDISAGSTPTAAEQLFPGGSGSVTVTVKNPNTFRIWLPSLALDLSQGGGTGFSTSTPGCDVAVLSYTPQTVDEFVPPKVGSTDGELDLDLSNAVAMSTSAANACQGASITVYLRAAA